MAIAYTGGTSHYLSVAGTTDTISYTAGSGSNRGMVFFGFTNSASGNVMTSITYAGNSAVKVASYNITGNQWLSVWRLENVTSGTNNIVATCSASTDFETHCLEYTDANQTNLSDATPTNNTGSGSVVASITTSTDNCWLVSCGRSTSSGPLAAGSGTTRRNLGSIMSSGDSNGAKTPAGAYSMTWTGTSNCYSLLLALKPALSPTSNTSFLLQYIAQQ